MCDRRYMKRLICALPHVCSSVYEARRFSTAFALACFDLLRVDEFTSDSKSISGTHVLCFNDISFHKINNKEELYVKVCSSKTDQRHSSTTLAICEQDDQAFCPVRLIKSYIEISHQALGFQLFIHIDGLNLTRYQFGAVLQRTLSFCGVPGYFRSHSFRIGRASEAKHLGIHDELIKKWGRWSSSA